MEAFCSERNSVEIVDNIIVPEKRFKNLENYLRIEDEHNGAWLRHINALTTKPVFSNLSSEKRVWSAQIVTSQKSIEIWWPSNVGKW